MENKPPKDFFGIEITEGCRIIYPRIIPGRRKCETQEAIVTKINKGDKLTTLSCVILNDGKKTDKRSVVRKIKNVVVVKGFDTKDQKLKHICRKYVEEQKISCPECVYQSDRVILNAHELIEELCDVVGYYSHEDE